MTQPTARVACPKCGTEMDDAILHTSGIVVVTEQYMTALRELQTAADQSISASADGGHSVAIIPMFPLCEQKYARCWHCPSCRLIVVGSDGIIPQDEIPKVGR